MCILDVSVDFEQYLIFQGNMLIACNSGELCFEFWWISRINRNYDNDSIQVLKELDRPVILSISPGTHVTPSMSETIDKYVNMYRVTADDWDTWSDVASHFNISRLSQLSSILYALFNYTMLNPTARRKFLSQVTTEISICHQNFNLGFVPLSQKKKKNKLNLLSTIFLFWIQRLCFCQKNWSWRV